MLTVIGGMLIGGACKAWVDKYYPTLKLIWQFRH